MPQPSDRSYAEVTLLDEAPTTAMAEALGRARGSLPKWLPRWGVKPFMRLVARARDYLATLPQESVRYTKVSVTSEDLLKRCRDEIERVFSKGHEPAYVLCGHEEADEIFYTYGSQPGNALLRVGPVEIKRWGGQEGGFRRCSIYGVSVVVVPWMKGMVVLPDISKL